MKKRGFVGLFVFTPALWAAYAYYFSDTLTSINATNWNQNGVLTAGAGGLTSSDSNGGSLISKVAVPDGSSTYEVKATLTLASSGGNYFLYLRATQNALAAAGNTGTYFAVEIGNPTFSGASCVATLSILQSISGTITTLVTTSVNCHSGMTIRAIMIAGSRTIVYIDNVIITGAPGTSITSGQPGIGVAGAPSGSSIARVDLGPLDKIAPTPVNAQSVGTSVFPNRVDLQWQGTSDDLNGVGIAYYQLLRNGVYLTYWTTEDFQDLTVTAGTTYTYTIQVFDFHWNIANTTITVVTPPPGAIDPRRVGVRPTGSYWGSAGEDIDTLSGNVNFTMPLFKAMGRGGWGVGFNLTYNSQNWRLDPGGTWKLGRDEGYGYGWKLQAGSLTPYWYASAVQFYQFIDATGAEYRLDQKLQAGSLTPYWYASAVQFYQFIDATGAEYRLDQRGGVWTSTEGIYLSYDDSTANRLYFPDGSFWVMGSTSGGTEQDAGTMYPTLMEDSNGNQILIRYNPGLGVSWWANSSARISEIEDVRAVFGTTTYRTYTFSYNTDPIPHLTEIDNKIGNASESYTLGYLENQTLSSPFSPSVAFGTTTLLQSLSVLNSGYGHSFAYDPSGSAELTSVTFPYGGKIRWAYQNFIYNGSRTLREVQNRYLTMSAGGVESPAYAFTRPDGNGSVTVHSGVTLDDASGIGEKAWTFATTGAAWQLGLVSQFEDRPSAAQASQPLKRQVFTWTQDSVGNPYIGTVLITLDPTGANMQSQTTQTLDTHGNVTQTNIYDYGNLTTAARTYNNTYVTDSNYTSRYIFNRLLSSSVTAGSQNVTLVTNTYTNPTPTNISSLNEHDSNYGTSFVYRGNVTTTTPVGGPTQTITRDITGTAVSITDSLGHSVSITSSSANNYAVPAVITPNSNTNLQTSASYQQWLAPASVTQPNSATASISYDGYGRPSTSTSVYGASTGYSYSANGALPGVVFANTNGHWTYTMLDGFGRAFQVILGYYSGTTPITVSTVNTVYGPCACSPIGKVTQVSQPYAPNGTQYWTTYTYDGLGRAVSVALPDGSSTHYAYSGNTTTITDAAGKWKKQTMDAMGNLKQVNEPNPAGGADYVTSYTYDALNHLTQVSMPRPTGTQTRTFAYDATTQRLTSTTNPENGTVIYTYNSDGTMATKTDAKNQQTQYGYDTYKRLTQVRHYPVTGQAEDTSQQVNYQYDANTLDTSGTFSQNIWGRLAAVSYGTMADIHLAQQGPKFQEWYSYTAAGLPTKKRLRTLVSVGACAPAPWNPCPADLDATYTYDNEAKMTSVAYPASGGTFTYSFDSVSRPIGLTDQNNNSRVSGVSYGPANELTAITYFGENEGRGYNNLLQLTSIAANGTFLHFSMSYGYSTGINNGTINSQKNMNSLEEVFYYYDSLNRLTEAITSAASDQTNPPWGDTYTYDGFSNLYQKTVVKGLAPTLSVGVDATTNRVSGSGYTYDSNGNTLTVYGSTGYSYDVENRFFRTSGVVYAYSPRNERVWKGTYDQNSPANQTAQEVYFYGVDGKKLGTYQLSVISYPQPAVSVNPTDQMVYFGNKPVGHATSPQITVFSPAVRDRLGSSPLGSYYPYGEDKGTPAPNDQVKFATYTRDSATGLDYAMNRYYANNLGRFMTPDPYRASGGPADPGSWNRYTYTRGDPTNRNDPTGLRDVLDPGDGDGGGGGGDGGIGGGEGGCDPSLDSGCSPGLNGLPCGFGYGTVCGFGPPPPPIVPPPPKSPPPPECHIELWQRPTPSEGPAKGWGVHTYIYISGTDYPGVASLGILPGVMIEAGPVGGKLTGMINPPGQGLAKGKWNSSNPFNNPPNSEDGPDFSGPAACDDVVNLINRVNNYNAGPKDPYAFLGTTNSNAFTFTLFSDVGLGTYFGKPVGFAPGWGWSIKGL